MDLDLLKTLCYIDKVVTSDFFSLGKYLYYFILAQNVLSYHKSNMRYTECQNNNPAITAGVSCMAVDDTGVLVGRVACTPLVFLYSRPGETRELSN